MWTFSFTLTASDNAEAEAAGDRTDSHVCVDCGINTAPGIPNRERLKNAFAADWNSRGITVTVCENSEVYFVKPRVWEAADIDGWGGCLCIGCLETRLGRRLKPKDFDQTHVFNSFPCTKRLLSRRDGA
jgi:hypothetical protein